MTQQLTILNGGADNSIFDRRILRRVALEAGPTGEGAATAPQMIAAVVDVETTGLSLEEDAIIEFALRRIHFDVHGVVTAIEPGHTWREDPGRPIPEEVTRLTGLTDKHVGGQRIDEDEVLALLDDVDLVIAHHAAFDKPFLVRRLEPIGMIRWGCSCVDVDWRANGFDGRGLGWLCAQAGWFFDGHRALADVDATITLLRHPTAGGAPILDGLLTNARRPRMLVEAVGADFCVKDVLRVRGYRWNAGKRVWEKEIPEEDCIAEEEWLAVRVYDPSLRPRAMGPMVSRLPYERRFL